METTSETTPQGGRSTRASGRATGADLRGEGRDYERDEQYDLLTAALIGVAIGAGAALLINAAVPRRRPAHPLRAAMQRGGKVVRRGGRAAMAAPDAVRAQVGDYLESARETITDAVESELKDLRRSIRRQRRRLGL